ncbi:MAG: helix-turn-helix transcriptional regulator [Acidaminococcus sp.]|nr:helix-turn-helix transcriptional regulator [Acidaminococcus sp.]
MDTALVSRLKEIMKKRKITIAELSKITGISNSSLSEYLKGKYSPKQDKIALIATALDVNLDWLIGLDASQKEKELINPEITQLAHEIMKNPIGRKIFSAAKNLSSEDMWIVLGFIEGLKAKGKM